VAAADILPLVALVLMFQMQWEEQAARELIYLR
jgi:hypothetical protein